MNLPRTNPASVADDGSEPVAEISARPAGFPVAASSAVASFFDLDEEAFTAAESELASANGGRNAVTLLTNADKTAENTAVAKTPPSGNAEAAVAEPGAVASASSERPFYSIPPAKTLVPVPHATRNTDTTLAGAEALAGVCREFDRLMADGAHSLRTAAAALGRSPSFFSGENSFYARFQRHGLAGLVPAQRATGSTSMAVPSWFVPAARFFYLLTNRTFNTGSMPEAVRRVISLPNLPFGWTRTHRERFLKAIGLVELPACPAELRENILARQAAGKPLVPPTLARQIIVNKSIVQFKRSPRDWSLDNQSAPGSQRRFTDQGGDRHIMAPGDWFGGDDATPGIAVCVPCKEVITPVSQKFGVLLGRFQWLAYHDARTDKLLAWDYVVRPRGSYRAEDILNGMGAVVRTHGIPNQGFQFEGGAWNSKLVKQAIALLGCQHWRTYSPHQKAIEAVFNKVWTRLAVQFPHADMGRYRNENEANCKLYEACKAGHQDPRKYFPTLEIIVRVFEEEVSAHNTKLIVSAQYGRWVPDDYFAQAVKVSPLRGFSAEMEWMFSPFAAERTVKGMMVSCRVPMFENFSVPFDFGADWLPQYAGKKVRLHFNPRQPKCSAKVVLLENANGQCGTHPGDILGDAELIGETAGHIRYILNWGDDDQRAGYLQRQRVGNFIRRETRGIGTGGRVEYSKSEERDDLANISQIEKSAGGILDSGSDDPGTTRPTSKHVTAPSVHNNRSARLESSPADADADAVDSRAARRAELAELERQTNHLFV